MALEGTILLDGAPIFSVRELLKFVKRLQYEPETLSLLLNKKIVLRTFQSVQGRSSSLVIHRRSAYFSSRLLRLVSVPSSFSVSLLTMTVADITRNLRFVSAGRGR